MKLAAGIKSLAAFLCISLMVWVFSLSVGASKAFAGPHCCPIIIEDVNLIKPEQLKPDSEFHVAVPILGKSTHRTRGHPSVVMMSVNLPSNYDPKRAHPVVVHLGGGVDQRKFIGRWQGITGNKDWIVLLAEYTSRLDSGPRNASQMLRVLEAATPVKHGAVVLAGISSGSWGMHGNFEDKTYQRGYMDPWDGFIFIAGNNNGFVSVTAEKLRGRPAMFVGGNCGGAYKIQKQSHDTILAAGGDSSWIDMMAGYQDFPHTCDPQIKKWLDEKILGNIKKHEDFDKKVAAAKTADDYIKLLNEPLHSWHGKVTCVTKYLDLVKAEKDGAKRTDMIAKLKAVPNLPRTTGGPLQDACVWLKDQPGGGNELALVLAWQNPFVNQVVFPPKAPANGNGYGPGVDFRAR